MSIEVRTAAPDEGARGLAPIWHYFGSPQGPDEERAKRFLELLPAERLHVALDGAAIVGGAGAFPLDLTIPGGPVRTAGVTVVGVLPSHRRRGILRGLMRAQLEDVHARGEPLAALWASEAGIYERFGYGMSFLCGDIDLTRAHARFARPVEPLGQARLVSLEEALSLFPGVYDRVAEATPGMIRRSRKWWQERVLKDEEWRRAGGGELAAVVLEVDGRVEAYALYRLNFAYDDGLPTGKTVVVEAVGATPEATATIWRYLIDIDWMERVGCDLLPLDHPLFHLLAEPGRLRYRVGDGLWMRLVDVGAALAERSFAGDGELVLEVADSFCPWNDARFALDGSKTMAEPDLRLSVDTLGSAYVGGFGFSQLARAGRVEEVTEGALARADSLFRTDIAPWCPEIF